MSAAEARVLIIEDNDALRVMLFTILRHQPLGVDTAQSADESMEKVRTCDYALIIIDMDLAAGGSLSFLETFQQERPDDTTFIFAVRDPAHELPIEQDLVSAIMYKSIGIDALSVADRD